MGHYFLDIQYDKKRLRALFKHRASISFLSPGNMERDAKFNLVPQTILERKESSEGFVYLNKHIV